MVRNGGVLVNGRKTDIPSFEVKAEDTIRIIPKLEPLVKKQKEKMPDYMPPGWVTVTSDMEGKVNAIPRREEIDTLVEEHLIVEYYSR